MPNDLYNRLKKHIFQWLYKKGFKIFHEILIMMLLVSMAPLISVWHLNKIRTIAEASQNADQRLSIITRTLTDKVENWENQNLDLLRQSTLLESVHKMENSEDQHPILRSVKQTYPWLFSVFTMNANGQVIGQSDQREKKDYKNRIYFQQVKSGNDIGQKVLVGRMTGEPAYALSAPIKDASGGLQGVIAMSASMADISQTIVNTKIGKTGFAFVVDQNGKVIAHWKKELSEKLQDYSQHPAVARALGNTERKIEFTDDKGNNIISFSRKTNRFNCTVVVQQNEEEVYASIREADKQALVLLIVTLVSVIVIAYIAAQRSACLSLLYG